MSTAAARPVTSNIPYDDPELRMLRKRREVALQEARALCHDDRVVASAVVHRPDGTVVVVQSMRNGRVLWAPLAFDGAATSGPDWKDAAPPVPDTPSDEQLSEVRRLDRLIQNRVETRGGRSGKLLTDTDLGVDVSDLVDPED